MTDTSPNLGLPYLLASQAQKHVIFNELVNRIDALLMLLVSSRTVSSPPAAPIDGQRYIIPDGATGEWQNQSGKIAVYQNLGWDYITPKNGLIAFAQSENQFFFYNGTWSKLLPDEQSFQKLPQLGINTSADTTNPLSAKLNNILFTAKYSNESGDGNLCFKLNKETAAKYASFIFHNNWSGRAEFGLLGDDNFGIKTSSDGSTWCNAVTVDNINNIISFDRPLNFPAIAYAENAILKIDKAPLFHMKRISGSIGGNLFIGSNPATQPLSGGASHLASYNTALGNGALEFLTTGFANTAIGNGALLYNSEGYFNTAIGADSLSANTTGVFNTAVGKGVLIANSTGNNNTGVGTSAGYANTSGSNNTALGYDALHWTIDGNTNSSFSNCTGIGCNSRVSASNQVQLGGSGTNTYSYGAVQDRSDIRDKSDIRDTVLGLDFICALRPVDYRWDMRDDYFERITTTNEAGSQVETISPTPKDGSKKRNRYHHGLIAQEVEDVIKSTGIDFGGFQNHSINGGNDVMSIGYAELIAPLIKAIQELNQLIKAIKPK